jgi:rhamnulokinase
MDHTLYMAIDLGAGSGRVFLGGVGEGELLLEEVRRFRYPARPETGHLRWPVSEIFAEIEIGLREAVARARDLGRPVRSLGVDSWGVDYGLLDRNGGLVENPISYRDERTTGAMDEVFAVIPREEVFARTGIQFHVINTLFQLYAHAREGLPGEAATLLLIPDLIDFFLTGTAVAEFTNATTTQMVDATTGGWDRELVERLGLPARLLPEIVAAGTDLGPLRPALADPLHLEGVRVVAPATHDTASAVLGTPLEDGWAYVSSGTWSLVGVERDAPLLGAEVARYNVTNEGGAFGTTRFLKNVTGLWILESCRKEWEERGLDVGYDSLLGPAEGLDASRALIFPDDPRLFNPPSMLAAISEQLAERGERSPSDPRAMTTTILDSLACRYASVLRRIEALTGRRVRGLHVVGGGSQNAYLDQATATATGLPVLAGPVEATVTGNVLVQAIAGGRFASIEEARAHVGRNLRPGRFAPQQSTESVEASRRYAALEALYET